MRSRWCVSLGKLDLLDEVTMGTNAGIETTRSFRRMPCRARVESRDSVDVCRGTVEPAGLHC